MKTGVKKRVVTLRRLRMSDPEAQFDPPVPGTMEARLEMVWPLTLEALALGGKGNAEQRLQRHVTRLIRGRG